MYVLHQSPFNGSTIISIERLSDGVWFPPDPANTDYAAYLAWLDEGNTPLPAPTEELNWDTIRSKRDQLIRESDWTMVQDASVDQAQWAAYRQILRDLPQTYTNPEDVVWPTEPSTSGPNTNS